jgi:hypothetical protein
MRRTPGLGIAMLLAAGTLALVALTPGTSAAGPYLNSSEPQCNGTDPRVLMCDDFEDGAWAETNCSGFRNGVKVTNNALNYAPNDGWCLDTDYADNFTVNNNFTVNVGAAGTSRAATSGVRVVSAGGQGMMASHGLPGDHTEIYIRQYIYFKSDYVGGHEKMLSIIPETTQSSGTNIITISYNFSGTGQYCLISYAYQTDGRVAEEGPGQDAWTCGADSGLLPPGIGKDSLGNTTPTGPRLIFQRGHWYYVEVHIRLNTITGTTANHDGLYDLWMDDCGTNGLGCTGPGTLRATYNKYKLWGPAQLNANGGAHIRGVWQENWSNNPVSLGTTYYDQYVVATRRIGPMNAGPTVAPAAPTALSVQ